MTSHELRESLENLSDDEFRQFVKDLGLGSFSSREGVIENFVVHPEHERGMAYLLGTETEAEKSTRAAVDSAAASKDSAKNARISAWIAFISMLTALLSLVLAIIYSPT